MLRRARPQAAALSNRCDWSIWSVGTDNVAEVERLLNGSKEVGMIQQYEN